LGLVLLLVMLCTGWLLATLPAWLVDDVLLVAVPVWASAGAASNAVSVSSREHRIRVLPFE
jgi:hypothetical protein